jgi:hypothetical protein
MGEIGRSGDGPRQGRQKTYLRLWKALRAQYGQAIKHDLSRIRELLPNAPEADPLGLPMSHAQAAALANAGIFSLNAHT